MTFEFGVVRKITLNLQSETLCFPNRPFFPFLFGGKSCRVLQRCYNCISKDAGFTGVPMPST